MNKEKLYKILEFNKTHSKQIAYAKNIFYDFVGTQSSSDYPRYADICTNDI